jgi:hypothetical protein
MVRQRSNEAGPHVRPSCGRKRERGLVFVRNPATTGVSTHVPGGPYRACYRLTGIPRERWRRPVMGHGAVTRGPGHGGWPGRRGHRPASSTGPARATAGCRTPQMPV